MSITLKDLLLLIDHDSVPLLEDGSGTIDCRPQTTYKITLRFMAEEDTAETVNISSPLLIPWYDCEVYSINPDEDDPNSIEAWLRWEKHIKYHYHERIEKYKPLRNQINKDFDKAVNAMIEEMHEKG